VTQSDSTLDSVEKRLKELALKYSRCRHGQCECQCTTEALTELGRISLIEDNRKKAKEVLR
jgi:hypothetical protein